MEKKTLCEVQTAVQAPNWCTGALSHARVKAADWYLVPAWHSIIRLDMHGATVCPARATCRGAHQTSLYCTCLVRPRHVAATSGGGQQQQQKHKTPIVTPLADAAAAVGAGSSKVAAAARDAVATAAASGAPPGMALPALLWVPPSQTPTQRHSMRAPAGSFWHAPLQQQQVMHSCHLSSWWPGVCCSYCTRATGQATHPIAGRRPCPQNTTAGLTMLVVLLALQALPLAAATAAASTGSSSRSRWWWPLLQLQT